MDLDKRRWEKINNTLREKYSGTSMGSQFNQETNTYKRKKKRVITEILQQTKYLSIY